MNPQTLVYYNPGVLILGAVLLSVLSGIIGFFFNQWLRKTREPHTVIRLENEKKHLSRELESREKEIAKLRQDNHEKDVAIKAVQVAVRIYS